MCANILGETFCEVVVLKRAGLEKKDSFSLAVFEVLGQLLLEGLLLIPLSFRSRTNSSRSLHSDLSSSKSP